MKPASGAERELVRRLQRGDSDAFREVVRRYHASMVRVAATFVPNRPAAEDVVQETWLAVMRGIGTFEQRSSLRSWIFAILINRARTSGVNERELARRAEPLDRPLDGPAVSPDRFSGPPGRGAWRAPLTPWHEDPEVRHAAQETLDEIAAAIQALPTRHRQVIVLRDVEGWSAREVCDMLDISEANQRVLLHRARASVRTELEAKRDRS